MNTEHQKTAATMTADQPMYRLATVSISHANGHPAVNRPTRQLTLSLGAPAKSATPSLSFSHNPQGNPAGGFARLPKTSLDPAHQEAA